MTVRTAASLRNRLNVLWSTGLKPGDSTGWEAVDEFYTVAPGLVTVVTGWPGSGKSEWVDALAVNLIRQGWSFAFYSPENLPIELHLSKLTEKWLRKPFGRGPTERMGHEEACKTADEFGARIAFLDAGEDAYSIAEIVGEASEHFFALPEGTKRALVIDPWNELRDTMEPGETETKYISAALGFVRRWARNNDIHVFIVAHPAKQPREQGKLPVPRPDMIAGSQHWWNKADQAVTVWRDYDAGGQDVEIHIQKVRFKHHGRQGRAVLKYDRVTGTYFEPLTGTDSLGRDVVYSFARKA
jgi:twinkle protein